MSIDPKFVELTADEYRYNNFIKYFKVVFVGEKTKSPLIVEHATRLPFSIEARRSRPRKKKTVRSYVLYGSWMYWMSLLVGCKDGYAYST